VRWWGGDVLMMGWGGKKDGTIIEGEHVQF
jgi:hypothetical protein